MSMYGRWKSLKGFRHGYGESLDIGLDASPSDEKGHGAVQSFASECDINNIMAKFQRTGALEWSTKYEGAYADVTGLTFESAMDTVLRAQEMFDDLPVNIRNRFQNSPAAFFDFIHDDGNREEAQKLGLLAAPVVAEEAPPGKA